MVYVGSDDWNVYAFAASGMQPAVRLAPNSLEPDFSLPFSPSGPE